MFNIKEFLIKFRNNFIIRGDEIVKMPKTLDQIIEEQSILYGIEIPLIKAIIQKESSFKQYAVRYEPAFYNRYIKNNSKFLNHKYYNFPEIISSSYGYLQIMYTTALEEGFISNEPTDLYDPEINIMYSLKHLKRKINKYGLALGILAYNSGSPKGTEPRLEHNFYYLQKVAQFYEEFGGTDERILKFKKR
jgi:soluble lytic murein transglycosylase-like protein